MRSLTNMNWKYTGCSVQSVPSLSKVAIRSSGSTHPGPPSVVAAVTKSMIASLIGPSFQDGRSWAHAGPMAAAMARMQANSLIHAPP